MLRDRRSLPGHRSLLHRMAIVRRRRRTQSPGALPQRLLVAVLPYVPIPCLLKELIGIDLAAFETIRFSLADSILEGRWRKPSVSDLPHTRWELVFHGCRHHEQRMPHSRKADTFLVGRMPIAVRPAQPRFVAFLVNLNTDDPVLLISANR